MKEETKALIVMGLVAAVGAAAGITNSWNGDEVYRGKISQKEVLYQEGRYTGGNRMRVKDGGTVFELYDKDGSYTMINQNKGDNEKLSYIEIIDEKGNKEMYRYDHDIKENSLHGEHTSAVFEKCNGLYNQIRSEIREKIKDNYRTIEQKIPQWGGKWKW